MIRQVIFRLYLVIIAAGIILAGCGLDASPTSLATPTQEPPQAGSEPAPIRLPEGWTRIEPGGETRCALDTPYAFWIRPGNKDQLLVFFQGGGGCWSAETCKPGSTFYKAYVTDSDNPAFSAGVFDLDNHENPFRGYSMVFIPSCTGDVHWGHHLRSYPASGGTALEVYHHGFVNASAALEEAYAQFPDPAEVFVTGCSAGSVGSIVHAPYLIDHYTGARVIQLGDSLSFTYHRPIDMQTDYHAHDNFPGWIDQLNAIQPGDLTMDQVYTATANYYPENTFAQFNYAADRVQERFYTAVGGPPGGFTADLMDNLGKIKANTNNFRTYLASGNEHCILPLARFYQLATEGVRFRDWVADLAAGREIADVTCESCELTLPTIK